MKKIMVWECRQPVISLGDGAHIGRYPLAAVLGMEMIDPMHKDISWSDNYNTFFVNLTHLSDICVRIRNRRPDATIIAVPDSPVEILFKEDWSRRLFAEQLEVSDFVGSVSRHTQSLYGSLFQKPSITLPCPIGFDGWFSKLRETPKVDFILTSDHVAQPTSAPNVACVAALSRKTGWPVIYTGFRPETQEFAKSAGLTNVEWRPMQPYHEFCRLAAKARIGVDLYTSHGTGRNGMTFAYCGTPCIRSTYTDFEFDPHRRIDPYFPTDGVDLALSLLGDKGLYEEVRADGIEYVRNHHSFDVCRSAFAKELSKIE